MVGNKQERNVCKILKTRWLYQPNCSAMCTQSCVRQICIIKWSPEVNFPLYNWASIFYSHKSYIYSLLWDQWEQERDWTVLQVLWSYQTIYQIMRKSAKYIVILLSKFQVLVRGFRITKSIGLKYWSVLSSETDPLNTLRDSYFK